MTRYLRRGCGGLDRWLHLRAAQAPVVKTPLHSTVS